MPARGAGPLTMLVMDPLALPLSCACVDGVGQRRYELLASHIVDQEVFGRGVQFCLRRIAIQQVAINLRLEGIRWSRRLDADHVNVDGFG